MASTILFNLALLLTTLAPATVNASWRMYANTMVTARVDPLISPGVVSGHVHDYAGGNNFGVNYDYNDQIGSSCSSVEIQADKSGYWAPAVYYKGRDGSFKLLQSSYVVYYLHRGSNQVPFPEKFRMIAGSAVKNTSTPGNQADEAINFHCLGPDTETLQFPDQYCPGGVRVQIMFPSCWNGNDVTSDNFHDHVAYPTDGKEGNNCPSTHPVRLMTLFLEHTINTDGIDWYPDCLVLSEGDNVGWSSHADFAMGWDVTLLQQAINECTDDTANLAVCGALMQFDNGPLAGQCEPAKYLPLEDVGFYNTIPKLLGDNAVWGGGVPKVSTGSSNTPPLVAPWSVVANGWEEHGCINEGDIYTNTMTGDQWVDESMDPQVCVSHCDSKGFSMAGLENGDTCFCSNQLEHNGSMSLVDFSQCLIKCAGSHYEWCGGGRNLRVYTKTGAASTNYNYPPAGARLTQVYSADGSSVPAVNTPSTYNSGSNNSGSGSSSPSPSVTWGPNNPPKCTRRVRMMERKVDELTEREADEAAELKSKRTAHYHHRRFGKNYHHH